jgi:hypothetical protein
VNKTYLFLVPSDDRTGWQVATRVGRVVTTQTPEMFDGMPVIECGRYFLGSVAHEDVLLDEDYL